MHIDQWIILTIALVNAFAAWAAWQAKRVSAKTDESVTKLNHQVNGMREAAEDAKFAAGKEEQRLANGIKAAALAEGLALGKAEEKLQSEKPKPT